MEAKTPREFFEKILPSKFSPEKAKGLQAVAQVNITGAGSGNWIITIANQKMEIREGLAPSADVTLKTTDKDFLEIVNHRLDAVTAFMTGRLEFNGSIATGLKLLNMGFM